MSTVVDSAPEVSTLEAVILGIVQGASEFLPISSSGHLSAFQILFGQQAESLTLNVILHFATVLAVLVVFREACSELVVGVFRGGEGRKKLGIVILGAVPTGVAGLLLRDWIRDLPVKWPHVISISWLATAAAMWSLRGRGPMEEPRPVTPRIALWIGCWQIIALLPGVSRSGITIAAALWVGCRREEAASFSFLVAIPLILGATVLEVGHIVSGEVSMQLPWTAVLAGGVTAFVTGYLALRLLLKFLRQGILHYWAYYLVPVALLFSGWLFFSA